MRSNNGTNKNKNKQGKLETKEETKKGNLYAILTLFLGFIGIFFSNIGVFILNLFNISVSSSYLNILDSNYQFSSIFSLASIVLMIVGRVKYPENKFLEIIMWLLIIVVFLIGMVFLVFTILMFLACQAGNISVPAG